MDILECDYVAEQWVLWCGETQWSESLREFGKLGGKIVWWCGYPRSASAIPLCFTLILSSGKKYQGTSRLKDIKNAIKLAEST